MGLLDGGLQRVVSGVFGSFFLDGELHRSERTEALNGKVTAGWAAPVPIKVLQDAATEEMRAERGYTERDVRLIVLQIDRNGEVIPSLTSADQITYADGVRYQLAAGISSDAAKGAWTMRATPTAPPPP